MSTSLDKVEVTALLSAWRSGDVESEAALMRAVYPVLRDIARARLRRAPNDFTLQATELVSEAYARLVHTKNTDWKDRVHFFAVAARAIRNVVVDSLRAGGAEKRGGDLPFVPFDAILNDFVESGIDLRADWITVHSALNELETRDAQAARLVELKFFSGLTTAEIAEAMHISPRQRGPRMAFCPGLAR